MTEQEIEKKLEQFKSGLELFKAKLDDARETIGARDAQIEDIEKDIDVLQKMNNEKAKEIENLKELLSQKDNYEISDQQRHDMNTMNELAGEVSDLEAENEKLLKEKTGLDLENQYLKKEIEKLKQEITEVEDESIEVAHLNNSKVEALDKLRDEVQKAKENSDALYTENGNLKVQITSMELAYQELDLAKASLEDKLEKEVSKNKTLAEESLSNKTDIIKERDRLAKKLSECEKEKKNLILDLDKKSLELTSLQNEITSLKVEYKKLKEHDKKIISLPKKDVSTLEVFHYNLGTTSKSVMDKFISVIQQMYKGIEKIDGKYYLLEIKEAAKRVGINENDISVIEKRLLSVADQQGNLIFNTENNKLFSYLSCENIISWISTIKE